MYSTGKNRSVIEKGIWDEIEISEIRTLFRTGVARDGTLRIPIRSMLCTPVSILLLLAEL